MGCLFVQQSWQVILPGNRAGPTTLWPPLHLPIACLPTTTPHLHSTQQHDSVGSSCCGLGVSLQRALPPDALLPDALSQEGYYCQHYQLSVPGSQLVGRGARFRSVHPSPRSVHSSCSARCCLTLTAAWSCLELLPAGLHSLASPRVALHCTLLCSRALACDRAGAYMQPGGWTAQHSLAQLGAAWTSPAQAEPAAIAWAAEPMPAWHAAHASCPLDTSPP